MFLYILKSLSVIQPQNNKHENRFILSTSKAVLKLIYFHWSDSPPQKLCDQLLIFRTSTPFKDLFEL